MSDFETTRDTGFGRAVTRQYHPITGGKFEGNYMTMGAKEAWIGNDEWKDNPDWKPFAVTTKRQATKGVGLTRDLEDAWAYNVEYWTRRCSELGIRTPYEKYSIPMEAPASVEESAKEPF